MKQFNVVSMKSLKVAPWNPPKRIHTIGRLIRDIQENGLLYPILVTKKNEIVDGHRRIAACKKLGMTDIEVIVVEGDQAKLFAAVNSTGKAISGNDCLHIYLVNPEALTPRMRGTIQECEDLIGSRLLVKMTNLGFSMSTFNLARRIAKMADQQTDSTVKKLVEWMIHHKCTGTAERALRQGMKPEQIIVASKKNRTIKHRHYV